MLAVPSSRSMLITRSRSEAMTRGPLPVRTCDRSLSEGDVTDPVQPVLHVPMTAHPGRQLRCGGLLSGQVG